MSKLLLNLILDHQMINFKTNIRFSDWSNSMSLWWSISNTNV